MNIGFYATALGMTQQGKKLDVVSNNLANAATPGYKRDNVQFKDFMYESTVTQMDQGRIRQTGNSLDIALQGDGFLKVETDQGTLYTRAGNLAINKENILVTQQGLPVLGQNGPIRLSGTVGADIRIERDGQVFDGDDSIDTLSIAKFPPGTTFEKAQHGYFKPLNGAAEPLPADDTTIQQGALEDANFDMVQEMANMIEATRMFETYQKVLQTHGEMGSQITSKLGNG